MKIDDLAPSAAVPAAPASGGTSIDSLFGGGNAKEEPATSPLASGRAALPQAAEKDALASPVAGAPNPPTPDTVARNAADHTVRGRVDDFVHKGLKSEQELSERYGSGFAMNEVPGIGTAVKAAGKALGFGKTVNAITANSAGTSVLQQFSSKIGDPLDKLSDSLYTLSKSAQGLKMQWLTDVKNFLPKDWSANAEDIYHSLEDPSIKLTPAAQALKDKAVTPIMAKNAKMVEALRNLGVPVGKDVENYVGRIKVGQSNLVDTLSDVIPQGRPRGITTAANELKNRSVFEMQGASGETNLHAIVADNRSSFQVWRDKAVVGKGRLTTEDLDNGEVTFGGETYKLTQGTTKNIEKHTDLEYYHDPLLSAIQGNINLNEALRNAQFLEQLKHAPEFKSLVVAPNKEAPGGFRSVDIPQLRGYKFNDRVANILDDFNGADRRGPLETMGKITRAVTGSIFWNPLPHIFNVLDHKIIEGGLVGNLKAMTIGLPSTMSTALQAHKEVMTMGPLYREALKNGAGLVYPSVATKNFAEQMAQQLGTAPEMDAVAKAWGYANPTNMVKAVYGWSSKNLWSWNDVIMMHGYIAHMKEGATFPSAIKAVEQHIPNYRIPDKVAGSRFAAQALKSPAITAFGRYDYGRLASYGHMVKDLVGRDSSIGDRAKALDQMAMLAVSSLVIYPALDHIVRSVTGNDNANLRRFGAASVPEAIYKFSTGEKTWGMLMGSAMPLSPALKLPVELGTGTDTFTGKPIASEKQRYFSQLISPIGQVEQVASGRKSATEVMMNQLGINNPSQKAVDRREKAMAMEKKRRAKEDGK